MSVSSSEDEVLVYESETGFNFSPCDLDVLTLLNHEGSSSKTNSYQNVETFQRLLEEKENDLELAARIGQQLLEQNRTLDEKVAILEGEIINNQDTITQLKYDLLFKTELLEMYDDYPISPKNITTDETPVGSFDTTVLEKRIAALEEDNRILRNEAVRLADSEDSEKEKSLQDLLETKRLFAEANSRATFLNDELQRKTEESAAQKEELLRLIDGMKSLQEVNQNLTEENTALFNNIDNLKSYQDELTTVLSDLRSNYMEVVSILKETQDQLKDAQEKRDETSAVTLFDSLAYEIHSSITTRRRSSSDYFQRTFETVRCANTNLLPHKARVSPSASSGYNSSPTDLHSLNSSHELVIFNPKSSCRTISGSDLESSICPTPGGGSTFSRHNYWRLPAKLQIIKPLEGSSTLQAWSALATPHLGNLLENRPGIQTRVETPSGEIVTHQIFDLHEEETYNGTGVSTPAIFTQSCPTTENHRNLNSGSATTIFSANLSTTSASSCSSGSSSRSVSNSYVRKESCLISSNFSGAVICNNSTTDVGLSTRISDSDCHLKPSQLGKSSEFNGNTNNSMLGGFLTALSHLFKP